MSYFDGKSVLITGGTGSLGRAMTKRLLSGQHGKPKCITIFSRNESKQEENKVLFPSPLMRYYLGDIQNKRDISHVVLGQDIIIHTASMKGVGNCEAQPRLARNVNVVGTQNLIEAVSESEVDTVVNISSDKGKYPENYYGQTKLEQEQIVLDANHCVPHTRFIACCYGNVMGSNGSVIQAWNTKLSNGEPIDINDVRATRFLISLQKAVDTIITALEDAKRGEIYIPVIPSATLGDLADVVIGDKKVERRYPGMRSYEKFHETLTTEEEALRTIRRDGYFVVTRTIQDKPAITKPYISKDYLIGKDELRELLSKNGLLLKEFATVRGLN